MWKKILGGIVIFIVALVAIVMYATSGMTEVANEFFIHVKTKHYDDAYNMLSEDFQKSTTEDTFKNFLMQNSLTEYKSASWGERSFEGDTGKLAGTIETNSGGSIPLTMNLIKNGDSWKIYSIYKPASGIQTETPSVKIQEKKQPVIPSKEEINKLTQASILLFANGINAKSMSDFYTNISSFWQKETSIDALDKAFQPFFDAGIDFTVLKELQPIIDKEPLLTKENELIIEGHYPISPSVATFRNIYLNENGQWKLTGFHMVLK